MVRNLAGLLGLGLWLSPAFSQVPPSLPAEAPSQPVTPAPSTTVPNICPLLTEVSPAEPQVVFTVPGGPKPGLFGGIDFSLLFPHVKHDIRGSVPINLDRVSIDAVPLAASSMLRMIDDVRLPFAQQDATLAPKFMLGWRFDDGRGAVQVTYRNLATEGAGWLENFDSLGEGALFSRIDLNEVGLNYSTSEQPLGALWAIRWEVGARLATIYHDSRVFGRALGQRTTNYFIGAGPQIALDVTREIPNSGFALYTRIDGAELLGRTEQKFSERLGDPDAPWAFGFSQQDGSQAVPYLGVQAGLSWLSHFGQYRVTAGYEFNQWWNTGRLGDSRGYLQAQGLFLRTEFNY
jgi:hypothetical protein